MQMYLEADVDTSILGDQKIAVLGYGSQGRAHALNLKDSGFNVVVGLRESGASWPQAAADGLAVATPHDAVTDAAVVMFLTPDMVQKSLYESVVDSIAEGALLLFAHGFAIHYGQVEPRPDLDVALIAPKGPGGLVRGRADRRGGGPARPAQRALAPGSLRQAETGGGQHRPDHAGDRSPAGAPRRRPATLTPGPRRH
ncbi:MAG: NAD(P)-binding domain-containing protein [Woeseiaceae bacterium]